MNYSRLSTTRPRVNHDWYGAQCGDNEGRRAFHTRLIYERAAPSTPSPWKLMRFALGAHRAIAVCRSFTATPVWFNYRAHFFIYFLLSFLPDDFSCDERMKNIERPSHSSAANKNFGLGSRCGCWRIRSNGRTSSRRRSRGRCVFFRRLRFYYSGAQSLSSSFFLVFFFSDIFILRFDSHVFRLHLKCGTAPSAVLSFAVNHCSS